MPSIRDLTGLKFGMLTFQCYVGKNKGRQAIWRALCDCGQSTDVVGTKAIQGSTTSCGCRAVNRPVDMLDTRWGRLTVFGPAGKLGNDRANYWWAACDCGEMIAVMGTKLRIGHTKSCGCLRREVVSNLNRTHGLSNTGAYQTWLAMWARTTNPNHENYVNYGGRGITVCTRWEKFENFHQDMGDRPEGLSIERVNNDLDYSPDNCTWADRATQNRNQRPRKDRNAHQNT